MSQLVIYRPEKWSRLSPLPGPGTYRFLAQGDSWFSIGSLPPTNTTNLLKAMTFDTDACVVDFSQPGSEAGQMWGVVPTSQWVFNPLFAGMLNGGSLAYKWDGILLSAGGNDLIAALLVPPVDGAGKPVPQAQRLLLQQNEWGSQSDVGRFASEAGWETFKTHLSAVFVELIAMRDAATSRSQHAPLFVHSYCYLQPRDVGVGELPGGRWIGGPWLYKAVQEYAIPDDQWLPLVRYFVDRLFDLLSDIAASHQNIYVIDLRTALPSAAARSTGSNGDWENEIHPTKSGYDKLGQLYSSAVQSASGISSAPATPAIRLMRTTAGDMRPKTAQRRKHH